jgi:trans-aconitate methyltransferase
MSTTRWDAGLYDRKHAFVWEKATGLLELLAPKPGERVLDLGCGTGVLTSEIASTGAHVLGIDRSPEMIAEARQKYPSLQFEVCDARSLNFSQEFDAVFSNAVLHWVPQADSVAQGVARSLLPHGRFVAEFGGRGNVRQVVASLENALTKLGISSAGVAPWYYPSIADYSGILEKHGLEVVQAALFNRPTKLEDGERGFANWIEMFCGAFLEKVQPAQRFEFIRLAEQSARPSLWKSDHWELDYRRLRLAARKLN